MQIHLLNKINLDLTSNPNSTQLFALNFDIIDFYGLHWLGLDIKARERVSVRDREVKDLERNERKRRKE